MNIWVLLLIAGLLLAWTMYRERFEPTQSINPPPYNDDEKIRIFGMLKTVTQKTFLDKATLAIPKKAGDTAEQEKVKEKSRKALAGGYVSPAVEAFFTAIYKPATVAITVEDVEKFVNQFAKRLRIDDDALA